MIRWGLILIGAVLLPCVAFAEDGHVKVTQAFLAVCSAAIDEKPDLTSIAASVQMFIPGEMFMRGAMIDAVTRGRTAFKVFISPATDRARHTIIITNTTYSDARVIECRGTVAAPTARAELESLSQSLNMEGGFFPVPGITEGQWKKPGNERLVLVSVLSSVLSTVMSMQRIDFAAAAGKK
jgi:hypothetical protein